MGVRVSVEKLGDSRRKFLWLTPQRAVQSIPMSEGEVNGVESTLAACGVCGHVAKLNARICRPCELCLGRRMAELIAQARYDQPFALQCYQGMNSLAQRRFSTLLGDPTSAEPWRPRALALRTAAPGLRKAQAPEAAPRPLAKCSPSEAPSATRVAR